MTTLSKRILPRLPHRTLGFAGMLIALCAVLLAPFTALAQDFVPLQYIPGVTEENVSFSTFVNGLFWISITGGAVLAVIVIAIGGFQYMGGESFSSKEEGIKNIQGAVGGLLLILLTVIIFKTINPDILNLELEIEGIKISGSEEEADTEPLTVPPRLTPQRQKVLQQIQEEGVSSSFVDRFEFVTFRENGSERVRQTNLDAEACFNFLQTSPSGLCRNKDDNSFDFTVDGLVEGEPAP